MKKTIINQCGTEMDLENVQIHGAYFTATYFDEPIIGKHNDFIEPHTLNLNHKGAKEALEKLLSYLTK